MVQSAETNLQKIGFYRVIEEVGVGGLGRVFKGIDERSGHTVAIKVLHDRYTHNRKFLGIFHRELLIMSSLNHKHIVSYLDSCFEPPLCYIVTEFVNGWSTHALMKEVKRIPPLVALCLAMDVLKGIDYLHLHDTIHSDLSAANILLSKTGRVLVTDFGLSCRQDVEDYKNYMVGTPGYYSPEHISDAAISPQTDLYCTGLILFEMIAGRKAVPALTERQKVLSAMKDIDFNQIVCSDAKLKKSIVKFLETSLQFNPSRRFSGSDSMMFACYEILKKCQIRYARHGIKQYLIDQELTLGEFTGTKQDIYVGWEPLEG